MIEGSLQYYPVAISLKKKLALVAGGGAVAERKIKALIRSGAMVRLISPKATLMLRRLAKEKKIKWFRRHVQKKDIRGAHIIIAATNNPSKNKIISNWARKHSTLINIVDKPVLSNFISPAVFHVKGAIVTVYTDGKDPVLSRDVKNFLKERWDDFLLFRGKLQNNTV